MSENTTADESGDAETSSAATRWRWTNDILAGIILLAHVALVAGDLVYGVDVPARIWDVFAVTVLLATVWAFGRETVSAVTEIRGGGQS